MFPSLTPLSLAPYRRPSVLPRQHPYRSSLRLPPWQSNWSYPQNFRTSHHVLYTWLPYLLQVTYSCNITLDLAIHEFSRTSTGIVENGGPLEMDASSLECAYMEILRFIQQHGDYDQVSMAIRRKLSVPLDGNLTYYPRYARRSGQKVLRRFQAYAEISRQTHSQYIGPILCDFFHQYIGEIMPASLNDLILWGLSIYRSTMPWHQKEDCLALLLQICPDLMDEVQFSPSPHAQQLSPMLANVANDLGLTGMGGSGRMRPRLRGRTRSLALSPTPLRGRAWATAPYSRSSSPGGNLVTYVNPTDDSKMTYLSRPSTAPGNRSIERQAEKVIDMAAETIAEAVKLTNLVRIED